MAVGESMAARFERWDSVLAEGNFEEALEALEEIVGRMEEGRLSLDDTLRCYEFGVLIARRCEKMLDEAELRVSRIESTSIEEVTEDVGDEAPF